jgi:replicative DNA helicase
MNKDFEKIICMLRNDPDDLMEIRCIHDKNKALRPIAFMCTVAELLEGGMYERLEKINNNGYGIFASVNLGEKLSDNDKSFRAENIVDVTAYFIDADPIFPATAVTDEEKSEYIKSFRQETLEMVYKFPLKPSCVIETGKGLHVYYLRKKTEQENISEVLEGFPHIQSKLIEHFNSDKSIKDLPRIMRMPGFNHMKREPHQVKIIEYNPERSYTTEEILGALGCGELNKLDEENHSIMETGVVNKDETQSEIRQLIDKIGIDVLLPELNPVSKGGYYILDCPMCGMHEAFIYDNNLNKIICNRKNNCKYIGTVFDYIKKREKLIMNSDVLNYLKKVAGEYTIKCLNENEEQLLPLDLDEYALDMLNSPSVIQMGYKKLDEYIKGFRAKTLSIIGARTRSGKSTFMYNIILNILENYSDKTVAIYSYEVAREQIITKFITMLVKRMFGKSLSYSDVELEYKKCYDRDFSKLPREITEANEKLQGYRNRLLICDNTHVTLERMNEYLCSKRKTIDCLFVDYTELVNCESQKGEEQRIAGIVTTLRELSMELSIPVITLAQINRENAPKKNSRGKGEDDSPKLPPLEGLRYSGRQEHEAAIVMTLLNEKVEMPDNTDPFSDDSDITVLYVGTPKNRYGKPNQVVELEFDMKCGNIIEKPEYEYLPITKYGRKENAVINVIPPEVSNNTKDKKLEEITKRRQEAMTKFMENSQKRKASQTQESNNDEC